MIWFFWCLFLLLTGALVYVLFLRPILKAVPALKGFYADADSFWAKLKALGWNSLTVAWSYVMAVVGVIMQQLDTIAGIFGDPDLKANLSTVIGADTKTLGYVLLGISALTLAARLRSIGKA